MAKEMKTLGGYEIVDQKAREDIETLQNKEDSTKELEEKVEKAISLAKGATKAFVYDTYSDMISELNQLDKAELLVNYHIMIREVCVPDLWISGISDELVEYTYTSNEDFIVDLTEDGVVQVGHFVLSALETQKVDLLAYVKNTDYANSDNAGVVRVHTGAAQGLFMQGDKTIAIYTARTEQINKRADMFKPITPSNVDYAVKKALSDCKLSGDDVWTEEEKDKALELLGGVASSLVSLAATGKTIVRRAANGEIYVGTPTQEAHATTKKYVDDLVGSVESILTELHTHAESLIGGEA